MITEPTEAFHQLTWAILLAIPAIVVLLHVPLLAQWLWERARGTTATAA